MKKLIGLAAAGAMLLALAGCASDGGGGDTAAEGPVPIEELVVGFAQVGAESRAGAPPTPSPSRRRSKRPGSSSSSPTRSRSRRTRSRRSAPTSSRGRLHRLLARRRDRLGRGAQRGQGRRHPGGAHRPRRRQRGHSLYVSFLGSDFVEEGKKAGDWVVEEFADASETVNIVQLEGTTGSAPAIDRAEGFADVIRQNPNFEDRREPDRRLHPRRRQAGHGGAAEVQPRHRPRLRAQRRHGPGRHRGDRGGRQGAGQGHQDRHGRRGQGRHEALAEGKINFIVECSPLLGQQLMDIVKTLNAGGTVEKRIITEETTFTQEQANEALPDRQY